MAHVKILTIYSLLSSYLFSLAMTSSITRSCHSSLPFKFEYVFTACVEFGPPSSTDPIDILEGYRFAVPVTGGKVTGPAANGTIAGGTAFSQYYNNQTYEQPKIALYGTLDGGSPFFVQEEGIGTAVSHTTRIFLDTNGDEYQYLREGYILAHVTSAEDRRSLRAECYLALDS